MKYFKLGFYGLCAWFFVQCALYVWGMYIQYSVHLGS